MNVVTGIGAVDGTCDSTPFLKSRKTRKFMGKQDELAVVAAARALQSAQRAAPLGERCGLYLAAGYIPFEESDVTQLVDASLDDDGAFSMQRFSKNAFGALNPLLTFRVLPNMPAFHVSLNFDIQGPYTVTYPGAAQFYLALEEAFAALDAHTIDVALVAAVADQENFLVRRHFAGTDTQLIDAAACLVIEREDDAGDRVKARLRDWSLHYVASRGTTQPIGMTATTHPASLPLALARGETSHAVDDGGFVARSTWELA